MRTVYVVLGLPLLAACANDAPERLEPEPTREASEAPPVLLLATRPSSGVTTLHLASTAGLSAPLVTLAHHDEGVARALVHPSGAVLATLDPEAEPDRSFASSLYRLAPGEGPARLVDEVVYASRPLVTATGRVFVSRGAPGELGASGRVDALTVDEVDPASGAARVVLGARGFALFVAGAWENELVVYRVVPPPAGGAGASASILAVDVDTGASRAIADVPPMARDFSVDGGELVFQDVAPDGAFAVYKLPLAPGRRGAMVEVTRGLAPRLAPFAWPSVGLVTSDERGLSIRRPGGETLAPRQRAEAEQVLDVAPDGAWAAGLRHRPGRAPLPFVLSSRGALHELAFPANTRVAVAGFARGGW